MNKCEISLKKTYELSNENTNLINENDKLKELVKKLKDLRGNLVGNEQLLCRNCGSDYTEDKNFKWSCRVH